MVNKKVNLEFSSTSRIESQSFLKLKYIDKLYSLEDFNREYPDIHDYDNILKNCSILYRGREIKYHDFWYEIASDLNKLQDSQIYVNEILKNENNTIIKDFDLYRGGRFVHKAERCIEIALYYLMLSAQYFPTAYNHNWSKGYYFYFYQRANNLLTSIIWYNNCFDYIVQIVFLSQKLYCNINGLGPKSKIDTIIKKCQIKSVLNELDKESNNLKYQNLKNVLEKMQKSHEIVKELANAIKHRGGLVVNGLEPKRMYKIDLLDDNGNVIHSSKELDEVKELNIDIDKVLSLLYDDHNMLINALREIVDIIYELNPFENQ